MKKCLKQNSCKPIPFDDAEGRVAALILAAQDEDRARIARDLHDDVCQQISVVSWELASLAQQLPPARRRSMEAINGKLCHIVAGVRAISHRLHPSIVSDLGLRAAVEFECRNFAQMTGIPVHLKADGALDVRGPSALGLFRVLQECLHNVRRHARASKVAIALKRTSSRLSLRVQDFGAGFDTTHPKGLGLTSMRERMALAHGKLTVRSVPGKGTLIQARIETAPESPASRVG